MSIENSNNTLYNNYPIEQAFKFPLIITALLVLLPGLSLYWFFGDAQSTPRSLKLFIGNWISPMILWFFCASFLHLWLKKSKLKRERDSSDLLSERFIPNIFSNGINQYTEDEIETELKSIRSQNNISNQNLLNSRLSLFLNHSDEDIDETFAIKEREYMKGSFSLSRFMVWAIPIMGFIGTVWGISNGISHFSDAMTSTNSVTDVSAMLKESLPLVTSSLATAFDTTLLALLLSIPLMMLMLSLEKDEEAYLIDLDEKWFHDVKPLLQKNINNIPVTTTHVSTDGVVIATDNSQVVAKEITLLSTQIKALQETMEDLYETVFTSKLKDGSDK
ncbi:MAG: MotA/TolQ/ExbB proton channel family protein [Cocleimonas sp.]